MTTWRTILSWEVQPEDTEDTGDQMKLQAQEGEIWEVQTQTELANNNYYVLVIAAITNLGVYANHWRPGKEESIGVEVQNYSGFWLWDNIRRARRNIRRRP